MSYAYPKRNLRNANDFDESSFHCYLSSDASAIYAN